MGTVFVNNKDRSENMARKILLIEDDVFVSDIYSRELKKVDMRWKLQPMV